MSELLPPPPPPSTRAQSSTPTSPGGSVPVARPPAAAEVGPVPPLSDDTSVADRRQGTRIRIGQALGTAALAAPLASSFVLDAGALWLLLSAVLVAAAAAVLPTSTARRITAFAVVVLAVFGIGRLDPTGSWPLTAVLFAVAGAATWLLVRNRHPLVFLVVLPVAGLVGLAQLVLFVPMVTGLLTAIGPEASALVWSAWTIVFIVVRIAVFSGAARLDARVTPAAAVRAERRAAERAAAGRPAAGGTQPADTVATGAERPPAATVSLPGRTNTLAVLALVFGLLGSGVVPVVLGHVALAQIRRTGESGRGMAVAGLVLGYVALGAGLLLLIVYAVTIASISGGM